MALLVWLLGSLFIPVLEASDRCENARNITIGLYNLTPYVLGDLPLNSEVHSKRGLCYDKVYGRAIYNCYKMCGETRNMRVNFTVTSNVGELLDILDDNHTDFVFPISGPIYSLYKARNASHYQGAKFVATLASKRFSLVMNTASCRDKLRVEMFEMLTQQWPIVTMTLILAGIAGVIMWMLEARANIDEFPRSFLRGTYEGFWWAFVSMTTVGYGDKTPRSLLGRLFGVVWIMMGIIVISFFTATFSSAITVSIVSSGCQKIQGKTVAVLNNTMCEDVANDNGANKVVVKNSFAELIHSLQSPQQTEVEGILLEEYMAFYYLSPAAQYNIDSAIKITATIFNNKPYTYYTMYRHLMCGIVQGDLVLHPRHDEQIFLQYAKVIRSATTSDEMEQPFSAKSQNTQKLLIILSGVLGGLVFLAFLCDMAMRACCNKVNIKDKVAQLDLKQIPVRHNHEIERSLRQIMDEIADVKTRLDLIAKTKT